VERSSYNLKTESTVNSAVTYVKTMSCLQHVPCISPKGPSSGFTQKYKNKINRVYYLLYMKTDQIHFAPKHVACKKDIVL